jgi:hypothetical protein
MAGGNFQIFFLTDDIPTRDAPVAISSAGSDNRATYRTVGLANLACTTRLVRLYSFRQNLAYETGTGHVQLSGHCAKIH